MVAITVRQARAFLEVARQGSVTLAAKHLNKAQTSVTKSIKEFEQTLGFELFERSARGVELTVYGHAFYPKAEAAEQEFVFAKSLVAPAVLSGSAGAKRFFRMDVSDKWLDAFLTTAATHNVASAAHQLGITPSAVNASLRKVEDSLGVPLFERLANTLEPTSFTRKLVRHIKLARNLLRQGADEMASIAGVMQGRVVVGTLPFARASILPRAMIALLEKHPALEIATTEAPYDDLVTALRCGDVDFIVGALRGSSADTDAVEEPLLDDGLSVIVRTDHPLLGNDNLTWNDLVEYPWVLPRKGVPTRELFRTFLIDNGFMEPAQVIESSSFVIQRGLVMESDRLTVLSRHQCSREEAAGLLACLDIALPGTTRPIGLTTRAHGVMSPGATLLAEEVRRVSSTPEVS